MKRSGNDLDTVRAQDLLAQRATEGLDEREARELERLGASDVDAFDLAAAAVDLATVPYQPLPDALAARLLAAAPRAGAPAPEGRPAPVPMTAPAVPAVAAELPEPIGQRRARARSSEPRPPGRRSLYAAWSLTAAAMAFAVFSWVRGPGRAPASPTERPPPAGVAGAADAVTAPAQAGADPSGQRATGEIVWSGERQRGTARLAGLAPNDPTRARYQLWIFDATRDPRYPVDGGLFDVTGPGPVTVAIEPRVPVGRATAFMVTLEAPAGAVVSTREHVALTATAPPAR